MQRVIEAALRDSADTSGGTLNVWLSGSTLTFRVPLIERISPDRFDGVPSELVAELVRVNQHSIPIKELPLPSFVRVIESDTLRAWFASGITAGWETFRARTQSTSSVALSQPAFSPHSSRALLYVVRRCGPRCGDGVLLDLRAINGSWVISRSFRLWIT